MTNNKNNLWFEWKPGVDTKQYCSFAEHRQLPHLERIGENNNDTTPVDDDENTNAKTHEDTLASTSRMTPCSDGIGDHLTTTMDETRAPTIEQLHTCRHDSKRGRDASLDTGAGLASQSGPRPSRSKAILNTLTTQQPLQPRSSPIDEPHFCFSSSHAGGKNHKKPVSQVRSMDKLFHCAMCLGDATDETRVLKIDINGDETYVMLDEDRSSESTMFEDMVARLRGANSKQGQVAFTVTAVNRTE